MALLSNTEKLNICSYTGNEDNCPVFKMKLNCDQCIRAGIDKKLDNVEEQYDKIKASWSRLVKRIADEPELQDDCKIFIHYIESMLNEYGYALPYHAISLNLLNAFEEEDENEDDEDYLLAITSMMLS